MTQSLSVAEPQTGRPGVFADIKTTLTDIEKILSGAFDDADPDLFLYAENVDDRWKNTSDDTTSTPHSPEESVPITIEGTPTPQNEIPMVLSEEEAKKLLSEKKPAKKKQTKHSVSKKNIEPHYSPMLSMPESRSY
jgi:hypothetical protein